MPPLQWFSLSPRTGVLFRLIDDPHLGEFVETLLGEFDPDTGPLASAEGNIGTEVQMFVDPGSAAVDLKGDLLRLGEVPGPDGATEP